MESIQLDSKKTIIGALARRFLGLLLEDIDRDDVQSLIKAKLLSPLLSAVYMQVHPYVLMVFVILIINFSFSMLSCILCFLRYFK